VERKPKPSVGEEARKKRTKKKFNGNQVKGGNREQKYCEHLGGKRAGVVKERKKKNRSRAGTPGAEKRKSGGKAKEGRERETRCHPEKEKGGCRKIAWA